MTPPLPTGTWHDQAPAIADAARILLRLNGSDPDVPRLQGNARAACSAVDHWTNLLPHADRLTITLGGQTWWTWAESSP